MDADTEMYLDEVNELAIELEELGDTNNLERLYLTVAAYALQKGIDIDYTLEGKEEDQWSNVPP